MSGRITYRRRVLKGGGALALGTSGLSGIGAADPGSRFPILDVEFDVRGTQFDGPPLRMWFSTGGTPATISRKGTDIASVILDFTAPVPNVEKSGWADDVTQAFVRELAKSAAQATEEIEGDVRPIRMEAQKRTRTGGDVLVSGHLFVVEKPTRP